MMSRVWLIARHHFWQEAHKRSFLVVLFSLPLFLALSIGIGVLTARFEEQGQEMTALGYVDPGDFLAETPATAGNEKVSLVRYETREAAQAALERDEISAYYVLAADVAESRQAELVQLTPPSWEAQQAFTSLVQRRLLADQPAAIAQRALQGFSLTVHALSAGREIEVEGPTVGDFLPLMVAIVIGFLVMTTSGYLMAAMATEKENRTIEIMVSSVSTGKMMLGKIIGGLSIAALQLIVWLLCFVAAVWLGSAVLHLAWLHGLQPDWNNILKISLVGLPVYVFMAALMTAIGSTLTDTQDAQQAGGFYLMILYIPFFLLGSIGRDANGLVALAFSFFPPTAITTIALRMVFINVSWSQIAAVAVTGVLSAALMTWVAGKALRLNLLRYGQSLRLRELFRRQRTGREAPALAVVGQDGRQS
jgi:ABC-2 type transport system permease protein